MRLRNVKNAKTRIDAHPEYILSIDRNEQYILNDAFKDEKPLEVEIGAGKGQFIHTLASRQPERNHVAIERYDSVIIRALEKVIENPLKNLYLVRADASDIDKFFKPHSVDTLYLNFSDPWPKDRHEKRRLTHGEYLSRYKHILKKDGKIVFKTDNRALFEFSLVSMNNYNMSFESVSLDLHKDDDATNIVTEFEERFSKLGPIYKIIAHF